MWFGMDRPVQWKPHGRSDRNEVYGSHEGSHLPQIDPIVSSWSEASWRGVSPANCPVREGRTRACARLGE